VFGSSVRIASYIARASLFLVLASTGASVSFAEGGDPAALESSLLHRRLDLGGVRIFDADRGKWGPLKHERGKLSVIHLWAVECAPCVAEMPLLKNIAKGWHSEADVRFYMVSETLDEKVVKDFWFKTNKGRVPDTALTQSVDDRIREALGTNKQPVTLILDSDFVVRQAFVGALNNRAAELAAGLSRLLRTFNSRK